MVIDPRDPTKMTEEKIHATLQYLIFLKNKRCGRIKGRGCAVGRKQRLAMNKDKVSAPKIVTDVLMLTCIIDTMEYHNVATVDVPCAFIQVDLEGKEVNRKLEGKMVNLLAKLDPKLYRKYIIDKGRKQVLYVKLKKLYMELYKLQYYS